MRDLFGDEIPERPRRAMSREEQLRRHRLRSHLRRRRNGGLTLEEYRWRQAVKKRTRAEIAAAGKAWRAANRERYRELLRAWKKRNREKVKARKKASGKRLRAYLLRLQRGKCAICGTRLRNAVHVDHIIPVSRGGSKARSNLQLTHAGCNLSKWAKDPVDYARELGRLL